MSPSSQDLFFLVDRSLLARRNGHLALSCELARSAEAVLRADLPNVSDLIGKAASRKGRGEAIGARLVQSLDAGMAACVALVLLLRGARRPVTDALRNAYGGDPEFNDTIRLMCRRVFEPVSATPLAPPTSTTRPEAFAPPGR